MVNANKPHSKNNDFVNVVWNRLLTQLGKYSLIIFVKKAAESTVC